MNTTQSAPDVESRSVILPLLQILANPVPDGGERAFRPQEILDSAKAAGLLEILTDGVSYPEILLAHHLKNCRGEFVDEHGRTFTIRRTKTQSGTFYRVNILPTLNQAENDPNQFNQMMLEYVTAPTAPHGGSSPA